MSTKKDERINEVLALVGGEVVRATNQHPKYNSVHELYGVMMEEVEEFWEEVCKKKEQRNLEHMARGVIQIAAVCVRGILDVGLHSHLPPMSARQAVEFQTARDQAVNLQQELGKVREAFDKLQLEYARLCRTNDEKRTTVEELSKQLRSEIAERQKLQSNLEAANTVNGNNVRVINRLESDLDTVRARLKIFGADNKELEKELLELQRWVISQSQIADLGRPVAEHQADVAKMVEDAKRYYKQSWMPADEPLIVAGRDDLTAEQKQELVDSFRAHKSGEVITLPKGGSVTAPANEVDVPQGGQFCYKCGRTPDSNVTLTPQASGQIHGVCNKCGSSWLAGKLPELSNCDHIQHCKVTDRRYPAWSTWGDVQQQADGKYVQARQCGRCHKVEHAECNVRYPARLEEDTANKALARLDVAAMAMNKARDNGTAQDVYLREAVHSLYSALLLIVQG